MEKPSADDASSLAAYKVTRAMGAITNAGGMDALNASRGEMGVLGCLAQHDREATPSQLMDALGVSSARVANTLKALERKGYVVRQTNPEDGRGVIVRITPAGEAFGDVESVKAVSDLVCPVTGAVCAVNEDLLDQPELLNKKPYDAWIIKVEHITDTVEMLDAAAYEAFCAEEG